MIVFSTNDADLACRVFGLIKDNFRDARAFLSLAGGHFDIDVAPESAERVKSFLSDEDDALEGAQTAPTLEAREAECMEAIHGCADAEMDASAT